VFIKRFFEKSLAQTSYLIGCLAAREAVVIDPNRDADQYLEAAKKEGVEIRHVTETHIHADFLSGSRELASRAGAKLYLSDEGDADWKYGFAREDHATLMKSGERITIGKVVLEAVHTPGHTPEHLTWLVTDTAGATDPIAAATGDFIFVGDVGRPDLLERAAHVKNAADIGARQLFRSLQRFQMRPEWLQIWPAHGAGSACGKSISDIPQTTLGYERRFNWAFQIPDEERFVARALAGQVEPPKYFAEMKRVNRDGPRVLGQFRRPAELDRAALESALRDGQLVIDARPAASYAVGHIPGTLNLPLNGSFTTWAGWLVPYTQDFFVIVDQGEAAIDRAVRDLALIGLDRLAGWFDAGVIDDWADAGRRLGTIPQIGPGDLRESLVHHGVTLVDVRGQTEFDAAHIPGARHIPLGYLADRLDELPRDRPIVLQCGSGSRSSIGASLLRKRGVDVAINLAGGIDGWFKAGFPVET
jgi:hydroxyacylglutathione hydrolase